MAPKPSARESVFVFSNVVYSPDTLNCSKRSNLYTACCAMYQFNFTSFGSRRGRTSAQMEFLSYHAFSHAMV